MRDELSSRERMLAAIDHREPDHIPLWFNWHYEHTQLLDWDDTVDRVEAVLDMGLDDTMRINAPLSIHPDVRSRVWVEHPTDSRYPLIHKEWYTPKGTLTQVVQRTADWEGGDDVDVIGDLNVPRSLEFPIKTMEDIEKLAYFYQPPTKEQLRAFRESMGRMKALDRRRGVLIEGGWVCLGDMFLWLLGAQGLILAQADQPELVDTLLTQVDEWERVRIDILLDAGVDIITQRAWYESTDFWGVKGFRRFIKPRLKKRVELVHSAGAKFSWLCTTGIRPRLPDLLDAGIDILWGIDPVQDLTADLPLFKREAGDKICLLGGVNAQVTLVEGTEEQVREETRQACQIMGPGGGFILSPIDDIYEYTPKRNLEALIDAWRQIRDYPIAV
jgi:uroporphyrinogen decarboxylase